LKCKNQGFKLSTSVIVIAFFVVSTPQLSSMNPVNSGITNSVYAKYSDNQAQSLVNECTFNCVNSGPQNQADGAALAPIVSVTGGQNEEGPGGIGEQAGPDQELQVREVPSPLVEVQGFNIGSARASCDAGEVMTGGGYWIQDDNQPNNHMFSARDPDSEAWLFEVINEGPESVIIQAFAECTKLVDAS
jgi:hypothetical protein